MTFKRRIIKSVSFGIAVLMLAGTIASAAANLLGDADGDGEVTILDATSIQRSLAGLSVSDKYSAQAADVDGDTEESILDATHIQRWLASLDTPYHIGEPLGGPTQPPTETPTEQPTQSPAQHPTDSESWGLEIFRP